MYKSLLLASDQTKESLVALREGALIAQMFGASAHLLIIDHETPSMRMAEGMTASRLPTRGQDLLELGLSRLKQLGVTVTGQLTRGDPASTIARCVVSKGIDLIVLGHRRRSFIDRWWSGATGGYIIDKVPCSILIARDTITDAEFERHCKARV